MQLQQLTQKEILFLERHCIMTAMVITQRKQKGTQSQQGASAWACGLCPPHEGLISRSGK